MQSFSSIGASRAGNYAAAGKSAADSHLQAFAAQRKAGPDYSGLIKTAQTARAAVNVAGLKGAATVARSGVKAVSAANTGKQRASMIETQGEEKVRKTRMAGLLAAGKAIGSVFEKDPKRPPPQLQVAPVKPAAIDRSSFEIERPTAPGVPTLEPIPSSVSGTTVSPTSAGSTYQGIPRTADTPTGARVSQVQMKQLLMDQGMDEANATIGAAIGMAESGGDPGIRSHPDLEARTGEMSLGLWQHNANTGEDRHKFYGISNWNDLKDPVTNARATFRLWQRRGSWDDWGAYTDGAYSKYLNP